ncbi:MAG TPA: KH domain-containing protein [Bdellovibrionota bacterium]|nr:KH domain-containing protein [Bdellovibrionota bacterium]
MADSEKQLVNLIEYVVKALVDLPDGVRVSAVKGEQTTVIELHVAKEDLGKVIGKQGRTAQSLRTILNAASTKMKIRSVLEIIE